MHVKITKTIKNFATKFDQELVLAAKIGLECRRKVVLAAKIGLEGRQEGTDDSFVGPDDSCGRGR